MPNAQEIQLAYLNDFQEEMTSEQARRFGELMLKTHKESSQEMVWTTVSLYWCNSEYPDDSEDEPRASMHHGKYTFPMKRSWYNAIKEGIDSDLEQEGVRLTSPAWKLREDWNERTTGPHPAYVIINAFHALIAKYVSGTLNFLSPDVRDGCFVRKIVLCDI